MYKTKDHYEANKERYLEANRRKKLRVKEKLDKLKSTPCLDCGLMWSSYVMEFHHRDPEQKVAKVSQLCKDAGWDRVLEEIAKCDLLCSNCHRIREHNKIT